MHVFFQVISGQQFVSGFHIQIRDMSNPEDNLYYDVVTISGGGTRSHTLSDLRPATKYAIFIMPYHKEHIIGTPSNLKMVSTKEDGKPWRVFYFNDLRFHEKKVVKFLESNNNNVNTKVFPAQNHECLQRITFFYTEMLARNVDMWSSF